MGKKKLNASSMQFFSLHFAAGGFEKKGPRKEVWEWGKEGREINTRTQVSRESGTTQHQVFC